MDTRTSAAPPAFLNVVAALVTIVALLAFAWLYVSVIWNTWKARRGPTPNEAYLATVLSGLVGGFVASAFGQSAPTPARTVAEFICSAAATIGGWLQHRRERQQLTVSRSKIGLGWLTSLCTLLLALLLCLHGGVGRHLSPRWLKIWL